MEEVITQETLAGDVDVTSADGGSADQTSVISLDELKTVLGKEFKDPETALKSIKDTFNYVGDVGKVKGVIAEAKSRLGTDEQGVISALNKLMEESNKSEGVKVEAPIQPSAEGFITKEQYQEDIFFSKNQNLSEVKDILTPLKNANPETKNMSWDAFIATDNAKKVVDTFTGYNEVQSKRSVLESNPRLGVATDKLTEARTLLVEASKAGQAGDVMTANRFQAQAREGAVASVLEAYDLK